MPQKNLIIDGKEVQLSEPYSPTQSLNPFQGRVSILETITAAWLGGNDSIPLSPLLVGEPGVGKNRIVYEMAKLRDHQELYIFQGHEDVTAEDMACLVRFSDKAGDRRLDYILSPISSAMVTGGICFVDEIAKIRPRALALLVSLLDERRYMDSNLLGGRIKAHENFRFIAATNNADLINNSLPEFIKSRVRPEIFVDYQNREEIDTLFIEKMKSFIAGLGNNDEGFIDFKLKNDIKPLLDVFWVKWYDLKNNKQKLPTPRDVLYLFNLAAGFSGTLGKTKEGLMQRDIPVKKEYIKIEQDHLIRAFDEFSRWI